MVNAGEDVRVDPNLYESCQNLLTDGACKNVQPGHGRIVECLTRQIGAPDMKEDCQERLLEIQFFVVRDWTLNADFYAACKADAVKFCNAPKKWHDWSTSVEGKSVVLPCLYHHVKDDDDSTLEADKYVS